MTDLRIALIVGCARSGTSILGELIAAHPEVDYIFEAHHLWESAGLGVNDSHRLVDTHARAEVRSHIRQWFCDRRRPGALIVEKTPRNVLRIPFLREILPEARFIHIIRDGRDVACSMLPGVGGAEWLHLKPPSWQLLHSTQSGVMRCALAWKEIVEIALADLSAVPHLEVRYENLVARPEEEARRVLRHLELAERPEVTSFCTKIRNATDSPYHAQHQSTWYRDDHRQRVGRWRENIPPEEVGRIEQSLGALLRRLGYE